MRAFSSSAMAVLIIAALFWGNCLSCPQVLQSLMQSGPAHGCCHHSKKSSQDCSMQSLRNFVKADPATHDVPAASLPELAFELPVSRPSAPASAPVPAVHAPPDLLSLHASFRI
jgi:hypothetical protein